MGITGVNVSSRELAAYLYQIKSSSWDSTIYEFKVKTAISMSERRQLSLEDVYRHCGI
ncbi:MAG: hypothetical protein ACRC77_00255 [Bacteroidales bacterium]